MSHTSFVAFHSSRRSVATCHSFGKDEESNGRRECSQPGKGTQIQRKLADAESCELFSLFVARFLPLVTRGLQYDNIVTDAGALALGKGLKCNTSLQIMGLVSCVSFIVFVVYFSLLFIVEMPSIVTCCAQKNNLVTAMGISRIIACILHNDKLTIVYLDLQPYDCIAHQAWKDEGLSEPPDDVVSRGWSAVLEFLRKVHIAAQQPHFVSPKLSWGNHVDSSAKFPQLISPFTPCPSQ